MNNIKPIRTEADYEAALSRIDALMAAEPGTPEGDELDVLADLVEHYEEKCEPMGIPSAIDAIRFRMEQANLTPRHLEPFIGSRAKVSEVLSGKRSLTMPMARALHTHLGIPAAVLLRESGAEPDRADPGFEWRRFPIRAMAKLGWFGKGRKSGSGARRLIEELIRRAGGPDVSGIALFRKRDHARANAKADAYALKAWCWQALATANEEKPQVPYRPGTVTPHFLEQVARLSRSEDGPRRAMEFLREHGIPLVVVHHLPKTYLDGAALKMADGTPVVALTLRYDRLDNFWFCLMHELAHIGLHMDNGGGTAFVDDLTLRHVAGAREDPEEAEADEWAEEALVPRALWEKSAVRQNPTPMTVISLASDLQVHPAIVAGKVRHEKRNYRLLSQFVGTGQVRRQLGLAS